jgi:CO dehydrogenase maturation factor
MQVGCINKYMKIAFVGKGGSGKSTTTSLFIQYLLKKKKTVLAIDADINMHVSSLLGIQKDESLAISENSNKADIRKHLKGENEKIKNYSQVVKTTPPGKGSNLITLTKANYIMKTYTQEFTPNGYYMFVGTYESDEIGTACYHTNLAIFENILSHTILGKDEWIVSDMVAGTDAFSNTLHAQFDAIVLVIEPTPEGVSVYEQYLKLAQDADVAQNLYVVGNKIEDEADLSYLQKKIGEKLLGAFWLKRKIKLARQIDIPLDLTMLKDDELKLFEKIQTLIEKKGEDREKKLKHLHKLHRKYVAQDYITNEFGDISTQIDESFTYPQAKQ